MKIPEPKKNASGEWWIQLRIGGKSMQVKGRTASECKKRAALIKSQNAFATRKQINFGDQTLRETIESYIAKRNNVLSPSTVRGYGIILRNRFKNYMPMKIKDIDWQEMVNDEYEYCGRKTVKNAWGLVSAALKASKFDFDPATVGETPKPHVKRLAIAEIPEFIEYAKESPYQLGFLLALNGLRRSEIVALTYKNYDPNENVLYVRGAVVPNAEHKFVFKQENKNDTSARTVPVMIEGLSELLKAHAGSSDRIVTCHPQTLSKAVKRLCEKNGLTIVTIHGLRHTFAAFCYHNHVPQRIIMQWGGWKDQKTLDEIYLSLYDEDIAKERDAVTRSFSQKR